MDDPKPQQTPQNDPRDFQRTYDNEPETYVNSAGQPVTPAAAQQRPQLAIPKKKRGAGKWLVHGLLILLLTGLGAFSYWQWSEAQNLKHELEAANLQVKAAQAADKQENETDETISNDTVASQPKTISELATELVDSYKTAVVATGLSASLTKTKGDFVTILVSKPQSDNNQEIIYKKSGDHLVAISEYGFAGPSDDDKSFAKLVYGFDFATY